jgi:formylglycine-generating enzyme required for sulfatase activity
MNTCLIPSVLAIADRGLWLGLLAALGAWLASGCENFSGGGCREGVAAAGRDCLSDEEAASPAETTISTLQQRVRTNSVGMKLIWIPPGEFLMGSPRYEEFRGDDETQHRVRITRPFYLGVYEVTVGQFRQFVQQTGYRTDLEKDPPSIRQIPDPEVDVLEYRVPSWRDPCFARRDDLPEACVSWNDAVAFCRWLSGKEGNEYRLPTEAEWEYACRAGTRTRFCTGNDDTSVFHAGRMCRLIPKGCGRYVPQSTGLPRTAPVGSFAPNLFGLYDMHGNVWEWCADWYDAEYYDRSPTDDPPGPASGKSRVLRGGAYDLAAPFVRSANRCHGPPHYGDLGTGFRVAVSAGATGPFTGPGALSP